MVSRLQEANQSQFRQFYHGNSRIIRGSWDNLQIVFFYPSQTFAAPHMNNAAIETLKVGSTIKDREF